MLLAIDIGNSNIKLGVWNGRTWIHQHRLRTVREKTADEYGVSLQVLLREANAAISQVMIASVVPPLTDIFLILSTRYLGQTAVLVNADTDTGIQISADNPAAVGADRIVNAVAAHVQYPGPSIVVDMGTATKFEIITADGDFPGGVIAPGLRIIADALAERAAQLRHVTLAAPPQTIGKNTIHAVQSGLIYGYVGLVEGLLQRLRREHPDQSQPIQIIGTGGLIRHIAPHVALFDHIDEQLTLTGLRLIGERIRAG